MNRGWMWQASNFYALVFLRAPACPPHDKSPGTDVAVMTANLIFADFNNKTNAVWRQSFPARSTELQVLWRYSLSSTGKFELFHAGTSESLGT